MFNPYYSSSSFLIKKTGIQCKRLNQPCKDTIQVADVYSYVLLHTLCAKALLQLQN